MSNRSGNQPKRPRPAALAVLTIVLLSIGLLSSCMRSQTAPSTGPLQSGATLPVVAAENFWGSIAAQLGGDKVQVMSIITNPDTDPHDYEPTPNDARSLANARYVILNGVGYDAWAQKLVDANPVSGRTVLTVGDLVGKKAGDNPHLWYSPEVVRRAIDQMTADYKTLDPTDAAYFDQQRTQYLTVGLKEYQSAIAAIKQTYQGTPVGATESIFAYLVPALDLKLLTSSAFMAAIAAGNAPTATDKARFDQQLAQKQIKVLIYNSQNSTPDVESLKQKAQSGGIPTLAITETMTPATATFQDWQTAQLKALQAALKQSPGK